MTGDNRPDQDTDATTPKPPVTPGASSRRTRILSTRRQRPSALNRRSSTSFSERGLSARPRQSMAVVACMDARMDVFRILRLDVGDAHVIRNAGGVVTDDVIRSLTLSQRKLGTRKVVLVHHTDCGLQAVTEEGFLAELKAEVGRKPTWAVEAFTDPFDDVRLSIERLHKSPFIASKDNIEGFVYDVDTGALDRVR